jgi:hypothetical protein
MVKFISVYLISAMLALSALQPATAIALENPDETELPPVLISEVMTTGCGGVDLQASSCTEDAKEEFIELYNPNSEHLRMSDWKVEFLTSTHDGGPNPTRLIASLNGWLLANSHMLLAYTGYEFTPYSADIYFGQGSNLASGLIAKGGGHIRIVDNAGKIVDQVGWGSAKSLGNWPKTSEISSGFSIKRILPGDPLYDQMAYQFTAPTHPISPQGGGFLTDPGLDDGEDPDDEIPGDDPEDPGITCEGIVISELLPNPAGTDVSNEFIELHNPTDDFISLEGCVLQTTAGSKIHTFGGIEIKPDQYRAFYDSETGLTLPNSNGGTVYLLSPSQVELDAITYPGGIADDVAWAWFGSNDWQITYIPTPGASNVKQATKPCPTGQVRSEETGRCRSIISAESTLKPCLPGQERNPDTNRCRSIAGSSSTLVPCKPGQERNPETNRCRAVASASTLKPCAPGQERNPETNRCRKIVTDNASQIADVKDVESTTGNTSRWWLAGAAVLLAIGYGAWEWRHDIANRIARFKKR